jgi:hypothetical protein
MEALSRAPRVFYVVSVVLALGVGALQMLRVRGGFLTDYGADLFGTAWLYAIFRQGKGLVQRGRPLSRDLTAALVLAGCVGSEFGQRFGVVPGRYDPYDLAAFVAAVLACYAVDRWIHPLG